MSTIFERVTDENRYPHSPDVIERETADQGFSKGWGLHLPPTEKYWFDVHTHLAAKNGPDSQQIRILLQKLKHYNIKKISVILPMVRTGELYPFTAFKPFPVPHTAWFMFMDYANPDIELIKEGVKAGIRGIKLHNSHIITDGSSHRVWLSEKWTKAFQMIERLGLPVLWHVTQRLTDSPYTKGKRNLYWKTGWKKGVCYTNQDLLEVFLEVIRNFPGINFISAHQLHLGWDRLASLFDIHKNLYTDTSVGCYLQEYDYLYESDRNYIRPYFIKYSSRILFGTDFILHAENEEDTISRIYGGHIRFIRQLQLPDDVLQLISHQNAERISLTPDSRK